MSRCNHTPDQIQWVRNNCQGLTWPEAYVLFNSHFGLNISYTQFKQVIHYYKIKLVRKYTEEHIQWMRDNCLSLSGPEAVRLFNARFGLKVTYPEFLKLATRHKIKLGGKSYGSRSKPVGTVIFIRQKDGYEELRVKTATGKNKMNWVSLNQYLHLRELKKATREKLKEIDTKLHGQRYIWGRKKYKIDDNKVIETLMEGGTVHD